MNRKDSASQAVRFQDAQVMYNEGQAETQRDAAWGSNRRNGSIHLQAPYGRPEINRGLQQNTAAFGDGGGIGCAVEV